MPEAHAHPQWLFLIATLALLGLLCLLGWFRLRNSFVPRLSTRRFGAVVAGVFLVWVAVGSPLASLDHRSLMIHMLKHLLLMTLAAPLILAGVGTASLSEVSRRFIHPSRMLSGIEKFLTHPVFCWLAATTTVIGWHFPAVFHLAMRSHWIHRIADASFLFAGFLFWWPVMRHSLNRAKSSGWSVVLYLFLATLPCDILSAFLVFCNRLVYPFYLSTAPLFNLSPLQDQECAGALMWVWATFAYLVPAVVITVKILSPANSHLPVQEVWHEGPARTLHSAEASTQG
jgi:putative membrane protein